MPLLWVLGFKKMVNTFWLRKTTLKKLISVISIMVLSLSSGIAHSTLINSDPGEVGDTATSFTLNMNHPVVESVSMIFDAGKYISLSPQYTIFKQLDWGYHPLFGNFHATMEFGFLDQSENIILSSGEFFDVISSSSHARFLSITSPIEIYGIFFNVSSIEPINDNASVQVTINGLVKAKEVPAPSSIVLFGLGLIAIRFIRNKNPG